MYFVSLVPGMLQIKTSDCFKNASSDFGSLVEKYSSGIDPSASPVPGMMYWRFSGSLPSSRRPTPCCFDALPDVLAATIRMPCALSSRAVSRPSAPYPSNPAVRLNVDRAKYVSPRWSTSVPLPQRPSFYDQRHQGPVSSTVPARSTHSGNHELLRDLVEQTQHACDTVIRDGPNMRPRSRRECDPGLVAPLHPFEILLHDRSRHREIRAGGTQLDMLQLLRGGQRVDTQRRWPTEEDLGRFDRIARRSGARGREVVHGLEGLVDLVEGGF